METEDLNTYIFTFLVDSFAQRVRSKRLDTISAGLMAEGKPDDGVWDSPITEDDLRKGLEKFESRHATVLSLLQERQHALR